MNVILVMQDVNRFVIIRFLSLAVHAIMAISYTMRNFVQVILNLLMNICLLFAIIQILMNAVKEHQVVLSYVQTLLVVIHVLVIMVINSLMIITLVLILMSVLLIIMENVNKHVMILMVVIIVPVLMDTPLILMVITVQVYCCGLILTLLFFRY